MEGWKRMLMMKIPARWFRDERGAALMIVLIALVGLTVLGAAGLTMTDADIRQSENVEASTEVFYAADAGLQQYMGSSADGSAPDTFTVGSSTVVVTPTLMSNLSGGQPLYRLRSVANHTVAGVTTSRAVSTLAVYVQAVGTPLTVTAALASGIGVHKNGTAGTISGFDSADASNPQCPEGPGDDVAGVAVPPGQYDQNGKKQVPEGNPDIDDSTDGETLLEETGIDWEEISQNPDADYTIPPDSWPDFDALPETEWPVIFLEEDATVTSSMGGRGTIIARHDLRMNGSFEWEGVLLVGGALTSNGNQTIEGAAVTGLNLLLGETPPETDIGNGTKIFQYNSCYAKRATEQIGASSFNDGMALVPGSWIEEI